MEVSATLRNAELSAQKARLVVKEIRGLKVEKAVEALNFIPKKAAKIVKKVLESAITNAENNAGLDIDELKVSRVLVDQASMLKRMRPRAKGRGNQILKRRCHIQVVVSEATPGQ
ncbi:MAG TPA: 50S ribosomal protein L22 [Gammaproteobacteria bacterium]|nr:50S ribosomal protein L22 [Gammaproteobacteria bacterium]